MKKNILFTGIVLILILNFCKKNQENLIVYQSSLDAYDPLWYYSNSIGYTCGFNQGAYEISILQADHYAFSTAPVSKIDYPYSIKVDVSIHLSDTTKEGYAGFIYNFIDIYNHTVFLISPDGYFEIFNVANGVYSYPTPWTQTGAIKKGSRVINTIELTQNSSSIEVIINNTQIATFLYALTPNSRVGLIAHGAYSLSNFTNVVASFNNLLIEKL
jgi:hypothetical protein